MNAKVIFCSLALSGLLVNPGPALERAAALGAGGEIYLARTGTYLALFPGGHETDPGNPVLAIDVTRPGSLTQRVLVPFTKGDEPESSPALIYEDDSDTLFLVWERRQPFNSMLMLASFDGQRWSKAIPITSSPFSSKSSPQLAITRDTFSVVAEDGSPVTRRRTILHMIWEEEAAAGSSGELLYTPVILEEGSYLGWNPIYHLNDFVADGDSGSSFAPPAALIQAPTLQSGRDARTIVVGFASSAGRWLTGLEIDVLPEQLSHLADGARAEIIEIGREGHYPANRQALAEKIRSNLVTHNTDFHTDVIRYMADQIYNQILSDHGNDIAALAAKARAEIIEIGVRLGGRGLRDRGDTTKARTVEIDDPQPRPDSSAAHLIHFRATSSRPTPQVGTTGLRLFVSQDGGDMLVAWTEKDKVLYVISNGGGWSDQKEIKLSDSVSLDRAYELLAQRVQNR